MENYNIPDFDKIPSRQLPENQTYQANYLDEALVEIQVYSNGIIRSENAYESQGIKGAVKGGWVRKTVADKLIRAVSLLPAGYTLKIFDAWRPYEVQRQLYYDYFCSLVETGEYDDCTIKELHKSARQFVSFPEKDSEISFVHSSGGAVDLTIVDQDGNELDMGTGFDEFSPKSFTDYFEVREKSPSRCSGEKYGVESPHRDAQGKSTESRAQTIQGNRRMLYYIMIKCGFTNLPSEWWHFDYGDKFWAYYSQQAVSYKSIYKLPGRT